MTTAIFALAEILIAVVLFELLARQNGQPSSFKVFFSFPTRSPAPPPADDTTDLTTLASLASTSKPPPCDKALYDKVGLDAFVLIKLMKFAFEATLPPFTLAAVILFPLYATSNTISVPGYFSLTVGALDSSDNKIWVPFLYSAIYFAYVLHRLVAFWKTILPLRSDCISNSAITPTVLVNCIPKALRQKEAESELRAAITFLADDEVAVRPFLPTAALTKKLFARKVLIRQHEALEAKKGPDHKKLPKLRAKIANTTGAAETLLAEITTSPTNSDVAVVVCQSLAVKNSLLANDFLVPLQHTLTTTSAPNHDDLLWENISQAERTETGNKTKANSLALLLILFLAPILTFLTSISNLQNLQSLLPFIKMNPDSAIYPIVEGLLPVVAIAIFFAVVPIVLKTIAFRVIKFKSASEVVEWVTHLHFWVKFAAFCIILVSGSLFSQLDAFINDPTGVLTLLALAIPESSQIFANMALVEIAAALIGLSQVIPIVIGAILKKLAVPDRKSVV